MKNLRNLANARFKKKKINVNNSVNKTLIFDPQDFKSKQKLISLTESATNKTNS